MLNKSKNAIENVFKKNWIILIRQDKNNPKKRRKRCLLAAKVASILLIELNFKRKFKKLKKKFQYINFNKLLNKKLFSLIEGGQLKNS